ncbi:Pentapeptide repeat-containing protein [Actinacidiphila rubida]|uniref:Pentapeptide repeat-containing protein n=1 Tax=Actinacidiphila rubida TaxID=310780 RepID=A0A1H8RCS9_9ACTN|nr:Pentapeptide repeat-containing protein [Actinacidiphila rubida]
MGVRQRFLRRRTDSPKLPLAPVGPVLLGAFAVAIAVAAGVFYAGWHLLHAHGLQPQHRLSSDTLFDLVKLAFGVVAGSGALVALVVAFRKQIVDEDGALREATRLHTERFTAAVSQLGDTSAAVRLGGVHALAGLADDAPSRDLRQTCIEVLCAYLRLPYTAEADLPAGDPALRQDFLANREVRHTVIRLIRDHLRLDTDARRSWSGHDLDFTGVVFDGGDFDEARFAGGTVSFESARFTAGLVSFIGAEFTGGRVSFTLAQFAGSRVTFSLARFAGGKVIFGSTQFAEGKVDFNGAAFTGGTVAFGDAAFTGGAVSFDQAEFDGSTIDFNGAQFAGSTIDFDGAQFIGGTVSFGRAVFGGGAVSFDRALFGGGTVSFDSVSGARPAGLPSSSPGPLPSGLVLASGW